MRPRHNDVVQDMAGVSMTLAAAARTPGDPETAQQLGDVAAASRRTTHVLRNVLVGIYPPSLQRAGLASAVADLVETARQREIEVHASVEEELELAPDTSALVFRVVQEAMRNAVVHAQPSRIEVAIARHNGSVDVRVSDDGRGFDPGARPNGHLGVPMMHDLVRQAGGRLEFDSRPGEGTDVRARIPAS